MPRVNVSANITDESAVIPSQEGPSSFIAGYLDTDPYPNNMVGSLGFTHERDQGFMTISSVNEWHERLSTVQPTGYENSYGPNGDESQINIYPFSHREGAFYVAGNAYAGGTFERWPEGPEYSAWNYDWHFIENYLQYGGSITIFSQKSDDTVGSNSQNIERAKDRKNPIDGFISPFFSLNNDIRSIVNYRQDCIAITSVPSEHKAGFGFGRGTSVSSGGIGSGANAPGSGTTFEFFGDNAYDDLGDGVAKLPLDAVYIKNTGDNKYPAGRMVFSVFVKDIRPHNNQYGSSAEFIDAMRQLSVGSNEESYGVRGMTFDKSLLVDNDGVSGFTLFHSASAANDNSQIDGIFRYVDSLGNYVDMGAGTPANPDSPPQGYGRLPQVLQDQFKSQNDGITYFANTKLAIDPGRYSVTINMIDEIRNVGIFPGNTIKKLSETFQGTASTYHQFSRFSDIFLPSNWQDPCSWFLQNNQIGNLQLQDGYDILPGGKFTRYFSEGSNFETSTKMIDMRESLNPNFDYIAELFGPNGHFNIPSKVEAVGASLNDGLFSGQTTDVFNWKKQHNIFGSSGASLTNDALQFWGCTCGNDSIGEGPAIGVRAFVKHIMGVTPDVCVDFGPKSTTTDVTADGSTYCAYVGFSKKLSDNSFTGLVNIFGEYIGTPKSYNSVAGGSTMSDLIDNKFESTVIVNFNEHLGLDSKAIRIYPLVEDLSESGFALTADKTNYFYSISSNAHPAGAINYLENYRDKNWPDDARKGTESAPAVAGDPGNREVDYAYHWYSTSVAGADGTPNAGRIIGPTAAENNLTTTTIGMVGNPGSTARSQFFGITTGTAPSTNQNGITNDGIYLLAEIDLVNGLPTTGFAPVNTFDIEDVSYDNIFSSNADLYEFPVFGEKYSTNSFGNSEFNEIRTSNEIPFTSDVAGVFARQFRDLQPWFSPANQSVSSITDIVAERYHLSNTEQDDLYDTKINFIKNLDGSLRLFGDKTFADSTSTFSRVNVANLFIYLKKKLEPLGRRFLFEQNDEQSRQLFVNTAIPFLETLRGQRAISDFRVVCDETNNTPDVVDSNQFIVDIFIKPVKTINFIKLRLTNVGTSFELE